MDPIFEDGWALSHGKGFRSYRGPTLRSRKKKKKKVESILSRAMDCCSRARTRKNTEHGDGDGYFDSRPELTLSRL